MGLSDMRRFRYAIGYYLVLAGLWGWLSPSIAASTFYTLSDFQWYVQHADGSKQRAEILSQLSRRQVVVGILWSDAIERHRKFQSMQTFLQQPPATLPVFRQVKPGPSGGYFATYLITVEDQSLAGMAVLLNTLQGSDTVDYALPVLQLSGGAAAPFVEFTVVVSPAADPQATVDFLRRQPVTVLSQSDTTYTLRLSHQIATNILVVMRAFEEASNLVEEVRPVWLDVNVSQPVDLSVPVPAVPHPGASPPLGQGRTRPFDVSDKAAPQPAIEAGVTLDTGWNFPLIDVRQPVTYRLQIEHHAQIQVLPESIAPSALRRALARETGLPPELFDITEAGKRTEPRPNGRIHTRVAYILRVSKPGTYRIPALQLRYSRQSSRRKVHQFQSLPRQGYLLTVDAHLPADTRFLPGDILVSQRFQRRLWPWLGHLGLAMLVTGGLLMVGSFIRRAPRRQRPVKSKRLSPRQMRQEYQCAFQSVQDRMPTTAGPISAETRTWLRHCAALLRRLLGEWSVGDATVFEGGPGVSRAMITAHLQRDTGEQDDVLDTALHLLQEFDVLATAPAPSLAPEDYQRLSEAMQQTIVLLTNNEASRVLRASHSL